MVRDCEIEDLDIVLEGGLLGVDVGGDAGEAVGVVLNLGVEALLGLVDEVAVVLSLDAALEAERDDEADGDGAEWGANAEGKCCGCIGASSVGGGESNLRRIH